MGQIRRDLGAGMDPHLLPLEVIILSLAVLTGHCWVTRLFEGAASCEDRAGYPGLRQGCDQKAVPTFTTVHSFYENKSLPSSSLPLPTSRTLPPLTVFSHRPHCPLPRPLSQFQYLPDALPQHDHPPKLSLINISYRLFYHHNLTTPLRD